MTMHPLILRGSAVRDEQDMRLRRRDTLENFLCILGPGRTRVRSRDGQVRVARLQDLGGPLRDPFPSAQQEHRMFGREAFAKTLHRIHPRHALRQLLLRPTRRMQQPGAIGKVQVGRIQQIPKSRIARGRHQHLGVGGHHMMQTGLIKHSAQAADGFVRRKGIDGHAEKGHPIHGRRIAWKGAKQRCSSGAGSLQWARETLLRLPGLSPGPHPRLLPSSRAADRSSSGDRHGDA